MNVDSQLREEMNGQPAARRDEWTDPLQRFEEREWISAGEYSMRRDNGRRESYITRAVADLHTMTMPNHVP